MQHREPHVAVGAPATSAVAPGCDAPGRSRSPATRLSHRTQLAGAVGRGLHRGDERGAHLVVVELAQGGDGRAAGRGDLLAQHRRVLAGLLEHRRGAVEGLDDQLGGGRRAAARARRRPRSSPRRRRRCRPGRCREIAVTASWCFSATGRPCRTSAAAPRPRRGASSSQCAPGLIAAIPWSTRAGVLGMTRTTDVPSGSRDSRYVGRDAGGEGDDEVARRPRGRGSRRAGRPCPAA